MAVKRVCLVSCAARKRPGRHPARHLYVSDLFGKSAAYAEKNADEWFILSARYGLLRPETPIESYDVTLNKMPVQARKAWAEQVFRDLQEHLGHPAHITVLAGRSYAEHLVPMLRQAGHVVSRPLEGLGIGKQLKWLKASCG